MENLTIHLSNGSVLEDIMFEKFEMTISGGEVVNLKWTGHPNSKEKILFISPKDIVAVTRKETP